MDWTLIGQVVLFAPIALVVYLGVIALLMDLVCFHVSTYKKAVCVVVGLHIWAVIGGFFLWLGE